MTCISVSAGYTQQAQVGTEKGLSCNAVKAFAKDVYGRLWVGTINGANLISNGTVRQYQYFNVKGQDIVTGDVLSIGCSRRAVIATTNHIIDFDPDNDSTRLVTYDGKSIKLVNDDRLQYVYWPDDDDKPAEMLIHLTPAKGWKIAGIKAYTYNAYKNSGKHSKLTVRDNVKFTVKVDYEAVITYTLKKGSSKFVYTVTVLRAGE